MYLLLNFDMDYYSMFFLIGGIVWVYLVLGFIKKKFNNTNMFVNLNSGGSFNIINIAGFVLFTLLVFYLPKHINAPFNEVELYIFTAVCMVIGVKSFFLK